MTKLRDFEDATILITGGTGSFGRKLIETLSLTSYREIRVLSRDELKQEEMRNSLNNPKLKFFIGDVRNFQNVDDACRGVDYLFHAAALKQVPSCEFFPLEAVRTNILGSDNVARAAEKNGVKKAVFLSTDKAVFPINAMGMSKALMEKAIISRARTVSGNSTVFSIVRYGNVMCSRGSVIPLFVNQIKEREPLTITMPEMTRFLLPLEDAIELVLYAFRNAQQGDVFVKKAPASTTIDLANAIKQIMGAKNKIVNIGVRHGEKMFETLVSGNELVGSIDHGEFFSIPMETKDLNYRAYMNEGFTTDALLEDYTSQNTDRICGTAVENLLLSVPEFTKLIGK